jgi:hypothetical protein
MYNKVLSLHKTNNETHKSIQIFDLPYDILENILYFSDINSIKNLFLTCKVSNQIYEKNDKHIKYIIIKQVLDYFNITPHSSLFKCKCKDLKTFLCIQLQSIYTRYYNERLITIPDILIYILQQQQKHIILYEKSYNKLNDKHYSALFEYLLSSCSIDYNKYTFETYTPPIRNYITYHDLKYILLSTSNINIIQLVLKKYKIIDSELLHEVIYNIVTYYYYDNINSDKKLKLFINYYIYKKCFKYMNNEDNQYFHKILGHVISLRNSNSKLLLDDIFAKQKKYNIQLNYQFLINKCLEFDNIECIKSIFEYSKYIYTSNSIDTFILYNFMCIGEFNTILYIINILNDSLNSIIYLNTIKKGLLVLSSNVTFDKNNLSKLKLLNTVLSTKNQNIIQQYIDKHFK